LRDVLHVGVPEQIQEQRQVLRDAHAAQRDDRSSRTNAFGACQPASRSRPRGASPSAVRGSTSSVIVAISVGDSVCTQSENGGGVASDDAQGGELAA
jgi:hypothetical protein